MQPDKFTHVIANKLSESLKIDEEKLYKLLIQREKESNFMVHPGMAIISHVIKGRDKFDMIIVRSKMGMIFSDDSAPVRTFFVIVGSNDQKSFYMHVLMWLIQITENEKFEEEWVNAKDGDALRELILKYWGETRI